MSDRLNLGVEYVPEEWEHGLRCADCARLIEDRYSERLDSIIDAALANGGQQKGPA